MKLNTVAMTAAALALAIGMTACGGKSASTAASSAASSEAASSEAASSEAATPAEYTVNTTGAKVTELYLYEVGSSDKGENYAADGMADGDCIVLTREESADKQKDMTYVLEFTTEDGATQTFETLHYEVAPISLKSVDAAAGATAISFSEPEQTAEYTLYNTTGAKVTDLYIYEVGSSDKGENYAGEGMADGDSVVVTFTATASEAKAKVYVVEFTTEDGATQTFETLHFEVAPISLKSVDAAAGATAIAFSAPQK